MKRLAIFSTGGVGAGIFSQGLPALSKVVDSLSVTFDVTLYSLQAPDPGFRPKGYSIRSPSARLDTINIKGLRWLLLALQFFIDHLKNRYHVTLSFWAYPMGAVAVTLSKLAQIPSAVILLGAETANVPSIGYGHMRRPFTRRLVLWTCARSSALMAVAQSQLDVLRSQGLDRPDAHVVPLGAEKDIFPFEKKSLSGPLGPLNIVHVANLTEVKDQKTLIRAFALLRKHMNAKLRIVGPDSLNGAIQKLVHDLHVADDVEFTGPVPFSGMGAHYRWADLFLLTSLSEGQNRSLTEAAMCGVLQVSTPVGHIKDLGDDVAVLVKSGDPEHIAQRIQDIVNDRSAWERKVTNARNWAVAHSMDWTTSRIREILDELC